MRRASVRPSVRLSVYTVDLLSIDIRRRQRAAAAGVLRCDPRNEDCESYPRRLTPLYLCVLRQAYVISFDLYLATQTSYNVDLIFVNSVSHIVRFAYFFN